MFLFGKEHLCLFPAPVSVESSGEGESSVSGALKNSGVRCLREQGICSSFPGKSHPRAKAELVGEKCRQESLRFRAAAHQGCTCA